MSRSYERHIYERDKLLVRPQRLLVAYTIVF